MFLSHNKIAKNFGGPLSGIEIFPQFKLQDKLRKIK